MLDRAEVDHPREVHSTGSFFKVAFLELKKQTIKIKIFGWK